jgi:hypothetical protein
MRYRLKSRPANRNSVGSHDGKSTCPGQCDHVDKILLEKTDILTLRESFQARDRRLSILFRPFSNFRISAICGHRLHLQVKGLGSL